MPVHPRVVTTLPGLQRTVQRHRMANEKVALVPTMGALHEGHLSLVRVARRRAQRVIVSIFVNPAQFAPTEDFASYPRTFDTDVASLAKAGVDLIWAPPVETMYPDGFALSIVPAGPAKVGLEDAFRPFFFTGVATVVAKLLIQCTPSIAVFGEKDFQQIKVITQLARDLDLPVKIVGAPIVRESDGLAMSSRNAYLSPSERERAASLFAVLKASAKDIAQGEPIARVLDEGAATLERAGFTVDYLEARNAETLVKVEQMTGASIRLLVAARIGRTRLIDNVEV